MDDVLVASKQVIVQCYADVGVQMPAHAWGNPWESWLPEICGDMRTAQHIHAMKTAKYAAKIDTLPTLPPLLVARKLIARGKVVGVLTGASEPTARAILDRILAGVSYRAGLTWSQKREVLMSRKAGGVYIDDHLTNGRLIVRELPNWELIHYRGQTADELWSKVWTQ